VTANLLQEARAELYEDVPDANWLAFWKSLQVDQEAVLPRYGAVWTKSLQFFDGGRFDFSDEGIASVVIEAMSSDAETVVDLVAWPIDRPENFALAFGYGDVLGADQIENPASYFNGHPMPVWRTPERWLQHGGGGAVLLNKTSAPRVLAAARGRLLAEDVDHGRELARLLAPFFDPKHILAPKRAGQRPAP